MVDAAMGDRHGLRPSRGGAIVNLGSGCNRLAFPRLVDCTASKGGIEQFTKVAALELGPHGIRVNCAAPGAIEIDRTRAEIDDYADRWSPLTPLCRVGTVEDVAAAVVWLAGPEAAFVSGQTLLVDGGVFSRAVWPAYQVRVDGAACRPDARAMIGNEAFWVHLATRVVEIVGIAIIVAGAFGSLAAFLAGMARHAVPRAALVAAFRSGLGRSILLGLEFLVAADIINTVAVEPTLQSLAVLAGIVLIRTFLSFSLEVEIDGRWPWQKHGGAASPGADAPPDRPS
jgi:uncharacterized membrane protein